MKIQTVKIKDFKCLQNIEQEINGNNILLMGDNGVGKSSFIQFVEIALGKNTNIPPNATGEGEVIADKDGNKYTFNVKFKDNKPVVTVTSPDGMKDNRKSALASIVGAIDFDVDNFVDLSKSAAGRKEQIKIFKSFLSEEVRQGLEKFEANVKANYENRTVLNKNLKSKEASVKESPLYKLIGVKAFKYTEIKEVIAKLKTMNEFNKGVSDVQKRFDERKKTLIELSAKIKELLEAEKQGHEAQKQATEWLSKNTEHTSDQIALVEKELETVEKDNKDFTDSETLKKDIELIKEMQDESGELTAKIESEKQAIADAIRDMEAPIVGLSFDEEQLVYNGIPVHPDSLSTSEIMMLGIKLKIAENPDFGILFIGRGESLGAKKLKEIQDLGCQIVMEQVERGKEKLHIEIMQA